MQQTQRGFIGHLLVFQIHLCVQHAQVAVLHDDERVHFQHAHVFRRERLVEGRRQREHVGLRRAIELQRIRQLARVCSSDARGRVDRDGEDFLGRVVGDGLDIHAAFGRCDEGDARRVTVDEQREVELLRDRGAFLDIEATHETTLRACLVGDERHAKHTRRFGFDRAAD